MVGAVSDPTQLLIPTGAGPTEILDAKDVWYDEPRGRVKCYIDSVSPLSVKRHWPDRRSHIRIVWSCALDTGPR